MITKMRYASITVTDLDQALDFYVDKLGFGVVVQMPLPGGNQFVMVAPPEGGANLVFSLPLPGRTHVPSTAIAFEAEDVQSTYTGLVAKQLNFRAHPQKPHGAASKPYLWILSGTLFSSSRAVY